jgi:pilus assembly protein CpaC
VAQKHYKMTRRSAGSIALGLCMLFAPTLRGQDEGAPQGQEEVMTPFATMMSTGTLLVTKQQDKLQMVVNTSKVIECEHDIVRASVHNDEILQVRPIGRTQMMVNARRTGITQVDLYGADNEVKTLQVVVLGDSRELQIVLANEFPTATLNIRPIQNAVIVSGFVTGDDDVEQIITIAEQYYPTVINRISVVGVHTVMLHTQVLEVSRTKLRELGVDWQLGTGSGFLKQSAAGLIAPGTVAGGAVSAVGNDTIALGVISDSDSFFSFIRALRQNNLIKVMADPTVVAVDGRPASFNSGGEFPIVVPAGLGQVGIEFREFGTRLDFVSKVRGDGRIWLDVRPTISEIDSSRSVNINGISVPGLRSRYVDTSVELRAGQTLALAGLLQTRTETQSIGLPGLSDIPYFGAIFRANREIQNEVELLITVTPDFAAPMEPQEVPPGGPGFNSGWPTDEEFYMKGYMEVPVDNNAQYRSMPTNEIDQRIPTSPMNYSNVQMSYPQGPSVSPIAVPPMNTIPPGNFQPPINNPAPSQIPVSPPSASTKSDSAAPLAGGVPDMSSWRKRSGEENEIKQPVRTGSGGFTAR